MLKDPSTPYPCSACKACVSSMTLSGLSCNEHAQLSMSIYPSISLGVTAGLRRHKHMLQIVENAKRMLNAPSEGAYEEYRNHTYQRAMLNPQIDFISKQVGLVVPIQLL